MQLGQLPAPPREVSTNWNEASRTLLRKVWVDPDIPRDDLPAIIGRPIEAIARMAGRMKLGKRPAERDCPDTWTDADVATLRRMYGHYPRDEIAQALGRSKGAVSNKAHALNLSTRPNRIPAENAEELAAALETWARVQAAGGRQTARTPERRKILMRDWPTDRPAYEIAAEMNAMPGLPMRTEALARWARDVGISRPANFRPVRDPAHVRGKSPVILDPIPVVEIVARTCLHCAKPFEAPGRFIRLCATCRGNA